MGCVGVEGRDLGLERVEARQAGEVHRRGVLGGAVHVRAEVGVTERTPEVGGACVARQEEVEAGVTFFWVVKLMAFQPTGSATRVSGAVWVGS